MRNYSMDCISFGRYVVDADSAQLKVLANYAWIDDELLEKLLLSKRSSREDIYKQNASDMQQVEKKKLD